MSHSYAPLGRSLMVAMQKMRDTPNYFHLKEALSPLTNHINPSVNQLSSIVSERALNEK